MAFDPSNLNCHVQQWPALPIFSLFAGWQFCRMPVLKGMERHLVSSLCCSERNTPPQWFQEIRRGLTSWIWILALFCCVTYLGIFSHKLCWFGIYRVEARTTLGDVWTVLIIVPGINTQKLGAILIFPPHTVPQSQHLTLQPLTTLMKASPPTSSSLIFCSSFH